MDFQAVGVDILNFIKNNPEIVTTALGLVVGGPLILKIFKFAVEHGDRKLSEERKAKEDAVKLAHELSIQLECEHKSTAEARAETESTGRELNLLKLRLGNVKNAFANEDSNMWLRAPVGMPLNHASNLQNSIPIMLCGNLKGGVGKTTTSAALAHYFQIEHDERVLAIDLDYQGSLSSTLLEMKSRRTRASAELAMKLVSGSATGQWLKAEALPMSQSENDSRVVDCFYDFANYETRLTMDWLLDDTGRDVRFNLANVLLSDEIQGRFQRIIIDVPPRVTVGFINALCASNCLLVPTVLDELSAEAVGTFLKYLRIMKPTLFPALELVGVAGTMTTYGTGRLTTAEKSAVETLKRTISREWPGRNLLLEGAYIPRTTNIAEAAGKRAVYREAIDSFKPLGDAIYEATKFRRGLEYARRMPDLHPPLH